MKFTEQMITSISIKLIFYSFLFFSILSSYMSYINGYYGGDLVILKEQYTDQYVQYFFIFYLIPIILFYYFYKKTSKINLSYSIREVNCTSVDANVHLFFTFFIFLFLIIVTTTSVGTISREESNSRNFELIFALLQPNYLIILYILFYKDSTAFVYNFNFAVFVGALFFTGFTGYLLFFIPIIISWSIKKFNISGTIVLIILGIIFLPFLRILKFMLQQNLDIFEIIDRISLEFIGAMVIVVIDRFNYVPNIVFIDINRDYFITNTYNHVFYPYYQGYFGSLFYKLIYNQSVGNINSELTYLIGGFYDSNSTFPMISYFSLDMLFGFLVLYYSILVYLFTLFLLKITSKNNHYFMYLYFILGYLFLLQGWFWPFMNFLQALIIFTIFVLLINAIKKQSILNKTRRQP